MPTQTAHVPTENGSRYLQLLCKHWSHNLKTVFSPDHGTVEFPRDARGASFAGDALVTFVAAPADLPLSFSSTWS
ncbi:DUF2218 domain-containing protein [Amorphus sp. MBR-141]